MSVLVLVPITVIANGFMKDYTPMIVENGCNIGLNHWYIWLTALTILKLFIEIVRYMYIKLYH